MIRSFCLLEVLWFGFSVLSFLFVMSLCFLFWCQYVVFKGLPLCASCYAVHHGSVCFSSRFILSSFLSCAVNLSVVSLYFFWEMANLCNWIVCLLLQWFWDQGFCWLEFNVQPFVLHIQYRTVDFEFVSTVSCIYYSLFSPSCKVLCLSKLIIEFALSWSCVWVLSVGLGLCWADVMISSSKV